MMFYDCSIHVKATLNHRVLIKAGWGWWLTRTKPRSQGRRAHWSWPWSGGWVTWSPPRCRKTGFPHRGPGRPRYVTSRARWSRSGLYCGGLSSWSRSRRGSRTCGCSRCGSCLRSPSSWCLCRWRPRMPPRRSSPPPSSRLLQRGAPSRAPGAGSRSGRGGHCRTGGLAWGLLSCCLGIDRAVCRRCSGPGWAGRRLWR